MNRNLKTFGLGLLATLAIGALAASGASSNSTLHTGGHFTAEGPFPVKLRGHSNPTNHRVHLSMFGQTVTCTETYEGTQGISTATSVTLTPTYTNCLSGENPVHVTMNGCHYTFTIRDTDASTLHNELHLVCPVGAKAEATRTDGSCSLTFPAQTITNAVTYTTILVENNHAITADITAHGLNYEKHGACTFLAPFGTGPHTGASLTGSMTLAGTALNSGPTNITATGRNGH